MAGFRLAPRAARQRRNPWQRRRIVRGVASAALTRTVDDGFTIIELDFAHGTPYVSQRTYNKTVSDGFTVADSAVGANPSAGTATGGLFFLFSQGTTGSAYTRSASHSTAHTTDLPHQSSSRSSKHPNSTSTPSRRHTCTSPHYHSDPAP